LVDSQELTIGRVNVFRADLLKDKVIVVTGGGTGLGKAMALRFAELGARLVLTSRSLEHLEPTAAEIRAKGAQALVATADVRKFDEVEAMVKAAVARFGRIDALVNNAAGNFLCPTEDLSPGGFAAVVGIVLQGTFHATLACGRQMIAQGTGGSLLSIVATYVETGSAYVVPSACAKSGVLALTRSLAVEWAKYKIRSNAIAPGPFPTEGAWSRLAPPGFDMEARKTRIPARRFGEPIELANLATYLLADESAYVTGDCITIDGAESLMAGQFNELTTFDPTVMGQVMKAMRPEKK
jgi:NAD(P)-dependent dehydrogenase (short-subunit alcohol dehydrogenase family)